MIDDEDIFYIFQKNFTVSETKRRTEMKKKEFCGAVRKGRKRSLRSDIGPNSPQFYDSRRKWQAKASLFRIKAFVC